MTTKDAPLVIYYRESLISSVLADIFTMGFLGLLFVFNHFYLADSKITAIVFFVVFLLYAIGKANGKAKRFYNIDTAIEYLQQEKTQTNHI